MKVSKGFTLVELLTVVAIFGLLSGFLVGALTGVYKDFTHQLAVKKAYSNLHNLEILRRSSSRLGSFSSLSDDDVSEVASDHGNNNSFVNTMNSFRDYVFVEPVNDDRITYSMDQRVASIGLRFIEDQDLSHTNIAAASEATNLFPGAKTIYDNSNEVLDVTIYYREKDPMIASYIMDALHQR